MIYYSVASLKKVCFLLSLLLIPINASAENVFSPPALGEETKGQPAVIMASAETPTHRDQPEKEEQQSKPELLDFLGHTDVTELRRENGQVYRIELKHSLGGTQIIEENDSDGKIESTSNDIEETPNLAKWRLISW